MWLIVLWFWRLRASRHSKTLQRGSCVTWQLTWLGGSGEGGRTRPEAPLHGMECHA